MPRWAVSDCQYDLYLKPKLVVSFAPKKKLKIVQFIGILVGETEMVERARWYRKMIGGGTRQSGVATAPARVAVEEIFLGGGLDRSHAMAKRIEKTWTELGGKVEFPCQTNMVWTDLAPLGITGEELAKAAADAGLKLSGGRIVVHHRK